MIHCNKTPLSHADRKVIEEWLGQPGRALFQKFLEDSAALLAAEAGNGLIEFKQSEADPEKEKQDSDRDGADSKAKEAERLIYLNDLLNKMRDKDYDFFALSLSSRPSTK
jgi:hypothetical protein